MPALNACNHNHIIACTLLIMVHLINSHHLVWKSCKSNFIYNLVGTLQDSFKLKSYQFSFLRVQLYMVYWNKLSMLKNMRRNNTSELTYCLPIKFPPSTWFKSIHNLIHLWGLQPRWKSQIEFVATSTFVKSKYLSWQGFFWACTSTVK